MPRYEEYIYFYLTDESGVGFSKMTYAYTKLASYIGIVIGALVYVALLKHVPIKTMMIIASVINFISSCG